MHGDFQTSREMFNHPIWKNIVEFRLFFLIYGNAVFSEEGVQVTNELKLERGQWLRSTRKLQEDLSYIENRQVKTYSTSVINRCIKKLEREQRICTRTHELGTVFTVLNYSLYQGFARFDKPDLEQDLEQYRNSVGTVEEQHQNNNKNVKEREEGKEVKDFSAQIKELRSRYPDSVSRTLDEYLDFIKETRASKKISPSVVFKILEYFDKFSLNRVEYAMKTHMSKPDKSSAKENYTFAIARNTKEEEAVSKLLAGIPIPGQGMKSMYKPKADKDAEQREQLKREIMEGMQGEQGASWNGATQNQSSFSVLRLE